MDAEGVAEVGGVEVVLLPGDVGAGVVGEMEGVADVDAENEHYKSFNSGITFEIWTKSLSL